MSATSRRPAAIVGAGMSRFVTRRDDADLSDLLQEAASLALADANMDMTDIDAVVLAQAPDPLHGIGHPEQTASAALAILGKPLMRVHTGGATGISAAQAAWWAVASGRFERVLVVGAEKMGDNTLGAQRVLNEIWDPAYEALVPLNTIANCSLMTVRYMDRYGTGEEDFAHIASRLRCNGARNPNAHLRKPLTVQEVLATPLLTWPVRLGTSCPRSSGGCAAVLTSAEQAYRMSVRPAWIRAITARTDTYFMGDRMGRNGEDEYIAMVNLRTATADAYAMAGIRNPVAELDVVEPYVPFASFEPMMLEAMQLCLPGQGAKLALEGHWDIGGRMPVSPSGGVQCTNPISVTALVRVVEAAQQVRERAGEHQVDGARVAIATGAGGDSQFYGVAILDGRDLDQL